MQHNNSLNCLFGLSWYPRNSQTNKNTSKEIISFDLWSTINFHIAYDVTVNFASIIHTQCWNHSIILQSSIFSRKQRLNLSILDLKKLYGFHWDLKDILLRFLPLNSPNSNKTTEGWMKFCSPSDSPFYFDLAPFSIHFWIHYFEYWVIQFNRNFLHCYIQYYFVLS